MNNLVLVVTNYSNPTNPIVYYGNDFPASSTVNSPHATNTPPTFDSINNVQNVYLPVGAGTNFSVTVMGYRVNVNAVTAQTNNVVQDYALVISCGSGEATNVMTVTATPPSLVSNPTGDQLITYIAGNNQVLLNQFVGANTPLLGTNTIPFTPAAPEGFGPNGWQVTVGMTNQWHFYVITNTSEFSNAAFVTFNPNAPEPDTLSVPRMGVFGGTTENASRDADIDLYVTTDPTITNLNPAAIANCVLGTQVGAPLGPNFAGASLGRGTTEFVVDTNSQSRTPNVYYIGVKSEDQMAAEYGFISIFSQIPFSQMEKGNQVVNGLPLNVNIPDGSPALPGKGYVFGIAIYPMEVGEVTVSNYIWHQNFGDLFGTLTLNGSHPDVLNNHDSFGNPPGPYSLPYDDSVGGAMPGTRPSDGPGNLNNYIGLEGLGVWMLTEVDDSLTQTGMVNNYNLLIQPHRDLTHGINVDVLPNSFLQVGFVDVPPGATNLTVTVTNLTGTANPPLELFVKFGSQPTTNSFDGMAIINNPGLSGPGGSVSLGPPLVSGRYFVGIFNPSPTLQNVDVWAIIGLPFVPAQTIYNSTDTPIPILDDAVTTDSIFVPDNATISGMDVAIAVAHPRISDLVFHLISPDGTRVLLMENRGGTDPNGAGGIATITTNTSLVSTFEGQTATNYTAGQIVGGWTVAGNQVSVVTDPVNAYQGTNLLALANGALSTTLATVPGQTYTLTFAYRGPGIVSWWRGEGNANDSINNHNGTFVSDPRWTNGIVDQAFQFTGNGTPSARVNIPDSTDFILTNALTIEGWAWASNFTSGAQGEFLMRGDDRPGLDPYILFLDHRNQNLYFRIQQNNTLAGTSDITNDISAYLTQWVHLAATWDGNSGLQRLYINGTVVTQTVTSVIPIGALDPTSNPGIGIGNNQWLNYSGPWMGELDEVSLYRRALSPSEVKAIFQNGNAGKFDRNEFAISPSLSLAEAQISLNGVTTNIFGNNTGWQTYTVSFKATGSSTPLQIQGIEPGMLLDAASVVSVQTNYNYLVFTENTNLTTTPIKFAAPPFTFTPAVGFVQWPTSIGGNGHWYKAVTNSTTNPLDWALADQAAQNAGGYLATITSQAENNFVFSLIDSPNFFKGRGGNGAGPAIGGINLISGTVPADWMWVTGEPWGYTSWYAGQPNDSVPTRTIYFSGIQGVPAETWDDFGPTDFNMGGYVIERNSLPLGLFYQPEQSLDTFDGLDALGTWTLEIQDDRVGATNPAPLLLNWQLRFNYVTVGSNIFNPNPLILPALPEQIAIAGQLFTVTNAASGGTMPYTYTLTSTVTNGPIPAIDTNGVITWTPTTNQAPAVYTFTNVVTDANLLTATDIFQVLVVYTNGLPAFPGAGGPGGPAIGGRGGDVYHVINVNDGGPGSLRYGITNTFGSRTIVFDVSGTINLLSDLKINDPYLTIAGQTAPGDGITIQGYTTSVQDTHDVVVRFLRCRPGDLNSPLFQGDSFHFVGVTNSIADHISAAWSIDEALSTTHSTNISVQWSVIAQPLNRSAHYMDSGAPGFQAHGYGSLLRYGSGAVGYYHNLYADNYSRNPRPGDDIQLDFINNVVCNWGIFAGYNEDDSANNPGGYTNFLNYVGNYFIAGSNTTANPNIAFQANVPNAADTQIYQGTNFIDNNASTNLLNGINTGWGMFNGTFTQLAAPTPLPGMPITYTNPPQSYEQVLAFAGDTVAGASAAGTYLLRDSVDTNIVTGVRNKSGRIVDFISSNRFSGVYLITNSEATYTNYTGAGAYWQSQGVSNFVGVNPWPVLASAPQALDSDGDGIPDYWEITLAALGETSMDPALPNNNHLNPDGYTDLEHYINWLAAPHALTVSNTPVDVDLYAIVGRTGNWGFGVTNGTNGTVSLGIDGHTATFMPTNGFFGFASFGFSATNLVTSNQFDVTVSVMVSITNITYSSVVLASAKSASNSATNTVPANSIFYYLVKVPTNALFATNRLLFASGPVNLLFSGVGFPTGTNIGDYTLLPSSTGGSSVLSTTSVPTNIVQGGTYYLGVQNTGGTAVNFGVEVDFTLLSVITNISGPTITQTNINGTNGFLVQWSGPTNYQYTIQWKTNLVPVVPWNSVVNPVINVTYLPPFGHYSWFDDGSLTGGWPAAKFYRVLANFIAAPITNSTPITNVVVSGTIAPLTVSVPAGAIAATNLLFSATGPVDVWFNQTTQPTGDTNAGDVLMLSNVTGGAFVLTGSSVPPLVPGANYYLGVQSLGTSNVAFSFQVNFAYASTNPPSISSITVTNLNGTNAVLLKWVAPTNYQFQVEWATNLAPAIAWHTVPNVVLTWSGVLSPTNAADGIFQYLDDGSQTGGWGPLKFYRLVEYPYATPIPQTLTIINAAIIGNAVRFQWVAPTNYQYAVLWTTNLGLPLASWTILANPVLGLSNGVYTFTDTNQTGPATAPKFFRLLEH
ncbi:MAG TPA: LamG-like jellyroll fold domain-containing protein [Verrucomicrobiae bacterium]|nr:LamG-like jellyroll fold domain-containing protein [Verrucomicrobiae bacterium]